MKKALLATTIAALTMSNAWAADGATTELRVTGKLLVGGCTATVNGGNALDFGSHLISDLSSTAVNDIATKDTDLVIECPSATKVGWTLTDNKADSNAEIWITGIIKGKGVSFGVGKTAGNVNIGAYAVSIDSVKAASAKAVNGEDTFDADYIVSAAASTGLWAKATTETSFRNQEGTQDIITVGAKGTLEPAAYNNATYPLKVSLAVDNTTKLAISDDTDISGSATITLRYI
ncbi:DUF1120 domain-containing protein [Citrobacter koseri]|uniref:DUF1120 domain-containing protein n=1 Tax=Citrobacter koseri TaxID=545 RepID=UPI00101EDBFA|nr:DUF1120 domain-containing protein [Citrobacter koseri]RZB02943.1 DUF1120 domain-containing protein [Citrobacter koseri]